MRPSRNATYSARIRAKQLFVAVAALMLVACHSSSESELPNQGADNSEFPVITVYKIPSCGCCTKWVDHLKENGFEAVVREVADLTSIRLKNHIPMKFSTCHTALIDGYVVEGHVPAADIKQLLKEHPKAAGLVVPGMPMGSPGMEGAYRDSYEVLLFDDQGRSTVFSQH